MARKPRLPPMRYPLTVEIRYRQILRRLVREMRLLVNEILIPILAMLVESAAPIRFDADDWNDQVRIALEKVTKRIDPQARLTERQLERLADDTNNYNQKEWRRIIRRAYGVDPTREAPDKYKAQLSNWANENAKLIKDIPQKAINQIRQETIDALQRGTTSSDLRDIIQERLSVSDSRASLIARDQIAKLNGDLTKERQEDAGVEQYIWRTVGDERVRDTHDDCDGETFTWDGSHSENGVPKPDGNDPGGDFQCRCYAEPILPALMNFEVELELAEAA